MEILYPDVVGSGGAPKRIMKPRRRTDGAVADDGEMPGTSVLNLHNNAPQANMASPDQQQRPVLSETPTGSSSGSLPTPQMPGTSVPSMIPSQTASTTNSNALTPPDEVVPQATQAQGRKRRQTTSADAVISPPLTSSQPGVTSSASSPQKRRRTSRNGSVTGSAPAVSVSSTAGQASAPVQLGLVEEMLEALKSRGVPRWREQALDIFFRDFAAEEYDLQVKISENVLSNEHKALVFCKMPDRVRQHWVSKFREMHQLNNKGS